MRETPKDAKQKKSPKLPIRKAQFASPYENIEPGETRVTDIAAQVPSLFLEITIALRTCGIELPRQLADWLFTPEQITTAYNKELLNRQTD